MTALVVVSLSATTTAAGAHAVRHVRFPAPAVQGSQTVAAAPGPGKVRYAVLPYKNAPSRQALIQAIAANTTVLGTTYSVTAGQDGHNYNYFIVGQNVTNTNSTSTFSAQVIPLTITFTGTGDVYDPTSVNSSCGETVSPLTGLLTGPELTSRNWYAGHTFVGHTEYLGSQMRGEFWGNTNPHGSSPKWDVILNGSNPVDASQSISDPESDPGTCSELGEEDLNSFDADIQSFLNTVGSGIGSTTFPIILVKNVVFTQNGGATCCVLGYHSAFTDSAGNTQTYGVVDYVTDGRFGNTTDLAPASHEIAEWANDPFTNNPTPSWGHIGQVSGCQSNLEVGDPLSGTTFALPPPRPGGTTYHLQELAYFGWFYDFNSGVNGWYSTRGTFTSGASLCS